MEKTLVKGDSRSAGVFFRTRLGWAYDNLCGLESVGSIWLVSGATGSTSTEGGRGVAVLVSGRTKLCRAATVGRLVGNVGY
jgi:hypothetical protein